MRDLGFLRLSWWQKTRIACLSFVLVALLMAVALTIRVAGSSGAAEIRFHSWLAFSAFPVAIVILIALFARMQERINIRSGGQGLSRNPGPRFQGDEVAPAPDPQSRTGQD